MKNYFLLCLTTLVLSSAFTVFLLVAVPNTRTELIPEVLEKIRASDDLQEVRGAATLGISLLTNAQSTGRVVSSVALSFSVLMVVLSFASLSIVRMAARANPVAATPKESQQTQ